MAADGEDWVTDSNDALELKMGTYSLYRYTVSCTSANLSAE